MCISELWDRLDSTTKNWLTDNPGCQILPWTMSAKISSAGGGNIDCDQHGQMVLTPEDRAFIAVKANATPDAPGNTGS
ncbi:hypothetical protein QFZ23_002112 [Arthrobacter globiformis]|uniref:hypothetical protein n=1 Tax=Arthrobacter globiformis TaxID=1665 RepID=UPI002787A792|nr:hypothetical protein [Arthrobacter globiformis]MDQ1058211.1 hypothetical protein [Arthrobacter globiformis]